MSVKHALLSLLAQEPMYGYQLRAEFESRTGATWPLNIGQVYTTLGRLERDGLVAADEPGADGQHHYRITDDGRTAVLDWFATPVARDQARRDEVAMKFAFAVTSPGVDVGAVLQAQRRATMKALQDYTRLKRSGDPAEGREELSWSLVVDSLIFAAEAEIRWLDHCEARVRRYAAAPAAAPPATRAKPATGAEHAEEAAR